MRAVGWIDSEGSHEFAERATVGGGNSAAPAVVEDGGVRSNVRQAVIE